MNCKTVLQTNNPFLFPFTTTHNFWRENFSIFFSPLIFNCCALIVHHVSRKKEKKIHTQNSQTVLDEKQLLYF